MMQLVRDLTSLPSSCRTPAAGSSIQHRPLFRSQPCIARALRPSETMPSSLQPFDEGSNWKLVLPPNQGTGFEGAVGTWARFTPGGELLVSYHGARLFQIAQQDGMIKQINIYSKETPGSKPREQDGNVQKEWSYSQAEHNKSDGWFHPFMIKDGPMRSRALSTSAGRVSSACFALPLPKYVAQHDPPPPFFGSELFFRSSISKGAWWSGGPLFDVKTGKVMCVFFIREYRMAVEDPSQPINLAEHPAIQQPREHLPKDLTDWLAGGDWKGVQEALVWEEGSEVPQISPEQPVQWEPPPAGHTITLLPDLFYAAYPMSVPIAAEDMPADGLSYQMGGLVSDDVFMRTVVSYGGSGRLASIQHEKFVRAA